MIIAPSVAALALALAVPAAAPAAPVTPAASGTLVYVVAGSAPKELVDPADDACFAFEGPAVAVENRTDAAAHLRASPSCDGADVGVVSPHGTWEDDGAGPPPTGVVMVRH